MADEQVKATEEKHVFQDEVEAANKARTGKGTRLKYGNTRGKGSIPIKWEAFDEGLADTLPVSIAEFMELTKVKEEKDLLSYLIVGFNDDMYTQASDPIAEFVNPAWDKDTTQLQFRTVVRTMTKAMQGTKTLEEVVAMIKPSVEAAHLASLAAKSTEKK